MGSGVLRAGQRSMRVLLVSSGSGSRGGGEIFLDYLGSALASRGHDIIVWMPDHSRMDELAERCRGFATVLRSKYRNTYDRRGRSLSTCFNQAVSRDIAHEWQGLKPDVLHLNKQNLEDGLDLLRAARLCDGLPSVCTIHLTQTAAHLGARFGWLRDSIAHRELGKYRGILVAVQETRRAALDAFLEGRARTETVFNGVPLVDYTELGHVRATKRTELGLTDSDFVVIGLGRLVEQKRPLLFLQTAKELHRYLPGARFLWVGDGALVEQWKAWVARENLEHIIRCVGWQSSVLPFLLAADLMLHVAEYEGLPLAIIEAMAAGVPVAMTRGFASEVPFFDQRSVFFLDDAQTLAGKLADSLLLSRVKERARTLVANELSIHAMSSSYERLYARALQG
ncbi:MAG TPA: glycosyltransferase family 4 protein [Blastocatellia bacterium]|nr:glycosyltransferase family 4 protein [Blastocatellia bacterium]